MQKSIGSLFWRLSMLMLSYFCAKTHQTSAFSIRVVIRQQPWHRQRLNFGFDAVLIAYSLTFSGSIGCNSCSLPLSGFPCTALPDPLAEFMGGIVVTGRAGKERKGKHWVEGRKWKEERKEECMDPFQHLPRALHDMTTNWVNENHRLDYDLWRTYNKLGLGIMNLYLGFITLCITEMAMHWNYPAKMLEKNMWLHFLQ